MGTSSNAIEVKALIRDGIKALNSEWDFSWGPAKTPGRMFVYLGEITWEDTAFITNLSAQEIFSIQLVVNHKARRTTAEAIETETLGVIKEIQAWVAADPRLADGSITEAIVSPKRMNSWPSDDFMECQAEAAITVTARFKRGM